MTDRMVALESVWNTVARIPRGTVVSYGEVARRAGLPRAARWIGFALGAAPPAMRLPWHRVVGATGRIAFPSSSRAFREQVRRLRGEGVHCHRGRVVAADAGDDRAGLDALLWRPRVKRARTRCR